MSLLENVEAQGIAYGHSNGEAGVGHQVQKEKQPEHGRVNDRILPENEVSEMINKNQFSVVT